MANIIWPTTLSSPEYPIPMVAEDNLVRSNNETGYPYTRLKFTRQREKEITLSWEAMPTSELLSLLEFYKTTVKQGILPFEWTHPEYNKTYLVKFAQPIEKSLIDFDANQVKCILREV